MEKMTIKEKIKLSLLTVLLNFNIAQAFAVDLSNIPLANSASVTVAPNIQVILDDSGSMAFDYIPDNVSSGTTFCKSGSKDGSTTSRCIEYEPPYAMSDVNGVYYNPQTRYFPPSLPSGYSYSSNTNLGKEMNAANTSNWTSVPNDSFKKVVTNYLSGFTSNTNLSATGNINLVTSYPDVAWCNTNSTSTATCVKNSSYNYPDSTYKYAYGFLGNPYYYKVTPGEYCSDDNFTNCTLSTTPTGIYTIPATVRYCTDNTYTTCQRYFNSSYTYLKMPGTTLTTDKAATGSITVTSGNASATITSITVNGVKINSANIAGSSSTTTAATRISNAITANGFSATVSGAKVTVTTPTTNGGSYNGLNFIITYSNTNKLTTSLTSFSGGVTSSSVGGTVDRVDIIPTVTSYPKYTDRTDCTGKTCTYADEMTNFANWFTYYRTRMQTMKSSLSNVFYNLSDSYRVGLFSINSNITDVYIDNFTTTQKETWLSRLFSTNATGGTPLRNALDKAGKIYSGANSSQDPVQYSCQQNFTFLATDGFWNDSTVNYTGKKYGGNTSLIRPFYTPNNVGETVLSDIAYYYYYNDLRPTGSKNKSGVDVSEDNVPQVSTNKIEGDYATWQHMTTFTLGLGLNGSLNYRSDYKTAGSGDYYNIKQGLLNWPSVTKDDETTIDDLWRAAVNGHGQYFSSKNTKSIYTDISKALASISVSTGTGSAAATSNLEPVTGDNYVYVASYRTNYWDGDVSAYTLNLSDGTLSTEPVWSAKTLLNNKINSNGKADTRNIYTFSSSNTNKLKTFNWTNLTTTEKAYFNNSNLTQYPLWSTSMQSTLTGEDLVNYVRGWTINQDQDRDVSFGSYSRAYRSRENILGDIINAQPTFVGAPDKNYTDSGYAAFKTANNSRTKVLYIAGNDGMLHALNAETGDELWAYIPKHVLPNLYKLADAAYPNNHLFYVDGAPTVSDVYDSVNKVWKTVLVGGFNKGAMGYYALDVTDPSNPKALWNVDETTDDFGYSYGKPIITKNSSGEWIVALTSGYNNTTGTNTGKGNLFILDPLTGVIKKKITNNSGSSASPSGLAKINNWVEDINTNNTTLSFYGGDLNGDMWKFDLDNNKAIKMYSVGLPITVTPELGYYSGKRILMFGTGKYLGQTDLTNTDTNYIYAIKDDMNDTTVSSINSKLTLQTTTSLTTSTRGISNNTVDWNSKYGWYMALSDSGERVSIDPTLQLGTLTIAANVPTAQACSPSGYTWLYQFNYRTGQPIQTSTTTTNTVVGKKISGITVGLNVVRLPNGNVIILRSKADALKPEISVMNITTGSGSVKKVFWRELLD